MEFYGDEKLRESADFIIESGMDFAEMRRKFSQIGMRLTLNEYSTIQKQIEICNFLGEEGGLRLKNNVIEEI